MDRQADVFQLAGGALLVWRPQGTLAFRAYELDGGRRFVMRLDRRERYFSVGPCFAYTGSSHRTRVVDLRSGRAVRTVRNETPTPPLLVPVE